MTTHLDQITGDDRLATDQQRMNDDDRYKLAIERANAADAWRSDVEAKALISRQRAQELEREADRFRRHIDHQKRVLSHSTAEVERLQQHIDHQERMLDQSMAEADRLRQHIDHQERMLSHATIEIERLNTQNNELHAQNAELLEHPSIRYAIIQRLRQSPLRPILRWVKYSYLSLRDSTGKKTRPETKTKSSPIDQQEDDIQPEQSPIDQQEDDTQPEQPAIDQQEDDTQPEQSPIDQQEDDIQPEQSRVLEPESVKQVFEFHQNTGMNSALPALLFITAQTADSTLGHFTLDLSRALAPYANILVWHVGDDGPLPGRFKQTATGFLAHTESRHNYDVAHQVLSDLCDQISTIDYAIVIGAECKSTLPALAGRYIPALTLLPDQSVYRHSVYFLQEILFWSTHVVFSTVPARDQALKICSYLNPDHVSALIPGPSRHDNERARAKALLNYRLHIPGAVSADGIVVGWGTTDYSSGLDIFVSCADAVRRIAPDKRYQFVWFAPLCDDSQDTAYPLAVQQQIQHSELADRVAIIYETTPDAVALSLADLVLFPARSDVFQHRAVEGLVQGTPVVMFTQATVLASIMQEQGFGPDCLARYGDVSDLAEKALTLLQDKTCYESLGRRLKITDWTAATLNGYAQTIMARCKANKKQVIQEQRDETTIEASGSLRPDYTGEIVHIVGRHDCSDARLYIKGWKVGLAARKPRPGLHPGAYAAAKMTAGSIEDPFAAYLQDGSPDGRWKYPVITPDPSPILTGLDTTRIALHIHAYYPDMLMEIIHRILKNEIRPDLFVSVRDTAARIEVLEILEHYDGEVIAVEIASNRGRNIGPFLTTFGARLTDDYDLIGHIHTKRSHHADRVAVDLWRNFLMENLLGGDNSGAMMDTILVQMAANPTWAIAFPDDPLLLGWDGNRQCAELLAQKMNLDPLPDQFNFPAGTMFWIRSVALQQFVNLQLNYDDYPHEPLPIDGTLLHSLERLFGATPRAMGMECALTNVPGITR